MGVFLPLLSFILYSFPLFCFSSTSLLPLSFPISSLSSPHLSLAPVPPGITCSCCLFPLQSSPGSRQHWPWDRLRIMGPISLEPGVEPLAVRLWWERSSFPSLCVVPNLAWHLQWQTSIFRWGYPGESITPPSGLSTYELKELKYLSTKILEYSESVDLKKSVDIFLKLDLKSTAFIFLSFSLTFVNWGNGVSPASFVLW